EELGTSWKGGLRQTCSRMWWHGACQSIASALHFCNNLHVSPQELRSKSGAKAIPSHVDNHECGMTTPTNIAIYKDEP
ncbi:MAG: hypothetical protein ACKPKO_07555, partial [Candidatus Fonsibacter sp.]